jgi:uncharacterized protein (DUF58 family)
MRLLYRLYRLSSGLQHWAQKRFTRSGWFLLCALFLSGIMGLDTENTIAYQAFTLLLILLFVAVLFSWFFGAQFSAVRLLPRFGTVGHSLSYSVMVKNLTSKPQNGLTLLEDLADPRPPFKEWRAAKIADEKLLRPFRFDQRQRRTPFRPANVNEASVPLTPPNHESEVRLELTPLRRGLLRLSGVTLARPDPFGFFHALNNIPLPQTTLILPKRYLLPPIALPGAMRYQEGGVALASRVGQSEEFVALRDYRPGDPLRHIHWRSWARTGKPVVREFEDEFFVRHALVLDTFADHPRSDLFEEAVSVAASFACVIQTQESLLDLLFVGAQAYCFTTGRGLAHGDQMLEVLASVQPAPDQPFQMLEHLVLNHVRNVSGCICVFLAWDESRREFVEKLRGSSVPLLVLVVVREGEKRPIDPGPMRDQPERFHVLEAGLIEQGLAKLS